MSETGKQFRGRVPEFYDRCLVPIIFEDYANEMANRVVALAPDLLLELATGTGAVTQVLREVLPKDCRIIASDLNDPMLEVARAKLHDETSISFRVVDAMEIPMENASVDVIACQFGVMFFPDKLASYKEALPATGLAGNGHDSCTPTWRRERSLNFLSAICHPRETPAASLSARWITQSDRLPSSVQSGARRMPATSGHVPWPPQAPVSAGRGFQWPVAKVPYRGPGEARPILFGPR